MMERRFVKNADGLITSLPYIGHESVGIIIEPQFTEASHGVPRKPTGRYRLFMTYRGQRYCEFPNPRKHWLDRVKGLWSESCAKYWGKVILQWSEKAEWRNETFGEETA